MRKMIITVAILLALSKSTFAQKLVNSELKNLLQQSLTYFPKVQQTQQSVQLAEDRLKLTALNKYPDITLDASYAYVQPKIEVQFGDNLFQFAPEHNYGGAINSTYTLFDFGRLKTSIEKSKFELQTARHAAEQLRSNLFTQIGQVYFQVIYVKKAIAIQDQVIQLLAENKTILEAQLKNGSAIQLDVLTIQSKIDNELNRKVDLENNLKKLLNLLNYGTGISEIKENELKVELKNYNLEEAIQVALQHNSSLAISKDKVNVSKSELAMSKLNTLPFIGLKASAGSKNGYLPTIHDQRFNYNAGVGFSMPLFNGGKTRQLVKIQERALSINQTDATALLHEFEKDIQSVLIDIQSNENRIKNAATQIEQAALVQKLNTSKLKNGTATPLEITSANADYQRALLNQLQYQFQLCNAQLELVKLMGINLLD